ncbi:hypothetical protein Sajous1_124 [Salmonella phage Sajous1]|uniref:Uncharacterized protein n=1 Tax=Salmonella phage PMBT18 TaxID=3229742 RepID=A0AB39C0N8_9CAUD|nr:hypothetical protein Sajous1_124 [Salmonella phage Sajous1]WDS51526.1 hypothetical protein SeF6a_213 [Salmonella phage SeF6a]
MRPTSSKPLSNSRTESEDDDSNAHQIQSVEATVVRTSRKATPDTLIQICRCVD